MITRTLHMSKKPNPTELMKAVKNPVEMTEITASFIWSQRRREQGELLLDHLFNNDIGKIPMTEISASDYLEARRREQENFIDLRFTTISAYFIDPVTLL